MKEIERRAVVARIEVRASNGKKTLVGYAALYDSLSADLGGFVEVIRPGAFTRALREDQEVLARSEHDTRLLLGRRSNGTLRLFEDSKGLRYEVDVPDTQAGRDMATLVERGDVRGSSFAFSLPGAGAQRWSNTESGGVLRELLDLNIHDVAPTADPAYPETSVSARALSQAQELRAAVPYGDLPIFDQRDHAWDASAADERVRKWASSDGTGDKGKMDWGKYRRAFFWYDADNQESFGGYKLGFADVENGTLKAVPRGVFAVAAVLSGSRGGVKIPEAEQESVKTNVGKYYAKMRKALNDDGIVVPWEKKSAMNETEKRLARDRREKRDRSFEDLLSAVWGGLCALLGSSWYLPDGSCWYVEATFDDHVIVATAKAGLTELYSYPMTFDADGAPVFGEPTEVEVQYVPAQEPASEAATDVATRAADLELERLREEYVGAPTEA